MGYSEIYCHLCGVSFNISRSRAPGEHELARWSYTGDQPDSGVEEVDLDKCARNGCCVVPWFPKEEEDSSVKDPDYTPPEDVDETGPDEYNSDHESVTDPDDADSTSDEEEEVEDQWYEDHLFDTLNPQNDLRGEPVWIPPRRRREVVFPIAPEHWPKQYEADELEHIAGPNCAEANAYSGQVISMEEMQGCRTAQSLIHKTVSGAHWQPDALDQDWERSEDWFLSGLSDGLASRDENSREAHPHRGAISCPWPENVNFDPEHMAAEHYAMPFHPWCFDIFCRQSKQHFSRVNISGLMKWRNAHFSWDDFYGFPRTRDVLGAQEQFWQHDPGKEYLAANPLVVPRLLPLLDAAVMSNGRPPNPHTGAFDLSFRIGFPRRDTADPLAALPMEIRLLILDHLGSRDIANVRLASRAYEQLPDHLWYRLVREDMPWLWEVWDEKEIEHRPSLWTSMTANGMRLFLQRRKRYAKVLRQEGQSGSIDDALDYLLPWPAIGAQQGVLPRDKTNWYQVYTEIKHNWPQLKGLQNRARIWGDINEIIQRIKRHN